MRELLAGLAWYENNRVHFKEDWVRDFMLKFSDTAPGNWVTRDGVRLEGMQAIDRVLIAMRDCEQTRALFLDDPETAIRTMLDLC
jgi:hypothetical protein